MHICLMLLVATKKKTDIVHICLHTHRASSSHKKKTDIVHICLMLHEHDVRVDDDSIDPFMISIKI